MITDIITLLTCGFLIWLGYSRGFLKSLIGPIALILGSIISVFYYALTKNIMAALLLGLFLPILLSWVGHSSLEVWLQMKHTDRNPLNTLSRVSGAFLSALWGMAILIITVLLMAMMPPVNKPLKFVYKDIHVSRLYKMIKPLDTSAVDKPTTEEDLKKLSEDKRIQDIISDPQIIDAINRKDFAFLIGHPKITAIMQDPELLKKMLSIHRSMGEQGQLPQ